jgi:hypothetical protein
VYLSFASFESTPSFFDDSAFLLFELTLSGQQRLRCIRDRISVPQVISLGLATPSRYPRQGLDLSSCFFRSNNTFREFGFELRTFESFSSNLSPELSMLLNQHARILVAIYQFGCRMSNTKVSPRFATPDGPVFVSNALCRKFSIPTV